jgi:hypothetical protein
MSTTGFTSISNQYSASSVSWSPAGVNGSFAGNTYYKAQVTLITKAGYTFTNVSGFTYSGASVKKSSGGADSITLEISFPATAPASVIIGGKW